MENISEALAAAVWQRIRFLAKSMMQYDSFVQLGGSLIPEPGMIKSASSRKNGGKDVEKLALEFLLLSLSQALEVTNFHILRHISTAHEISTADLIEKIALPQLVLQERLGGLQQAGFVEKNYDTAKYAITAAGQQLVEWIQKTNRELSQIISNELPIILGPDEEK